MTLYVCRQLHGDKPTQVLKGHRHQITAQELLGLPLATASGPILVGFVLNSPHPSLDTYHPIFYTNTLYLFSQQTTQALGSPELESCLCCTPLRMLYPFIFDHICGMQKFPGQGLNPQHSRDLSHCSDNGRSLTC